MPSRFAAVDTYLATAPPFARELLTHLREAVHRAVPEIDEQMKWSRPFFSYRGVILANMAAFQQHCSFGLWGGEIAEVLRAQGTGRSEGMGTFGRLRSVADLPPAPELESLIRQAAELIDSGVRTRSIERVAKPGRREPALVPAALAAALRNHPAAETYFDGMSPSCRREYIEWINGAKREETRARRVATAVEDLAAGRKFNWRYERRAAVDPATEQRLP